MKEIGWIEEPFGTPLPYQSLLRSHGDISRNGVIMHPGNHLHPGSVYDERDPALLHYELLQLTGDYVRPGRNLKKLFGALFCNSEAPHHSHKLAAQRPTIHSERRTIDVRSHCKEIRSRRSLHSPELGREKGTLSKEPLM